MKTSIIATIFAIFSIGFSKPIEKTKIWYYFGREGLNNCAEQSLGNMACTMELHVVNTKQYYPYTTWYSFENDGDDYNVNIWFNFNNTDTIKLVSQQPCNNLLNKVTLDNTLFNKLKKYNFDINYQYKCDYNSHTKSIVDFKIYQTTLVDNVLQSNISLASFSKLYVEYNIPWDSRIMEPVMYMQTTESPEYDMCRYCEDRECLDC